MAELSHQEKRDLRKALDQRKLKWEAHFSNASRVVHLSDPLSQRAYCGSLNDSPYSDMAPHTASLSDILRMVNPVPGSQRYCRRCVARAMRRVELIYLEEIKKLESDGTST